MRISGWLLRWRGRWAPRQRVHETLAEITEPEGRLVVLDQDGWRHIIEQHPEMSRHRADVIAAVGAPEHGGPDPRPHRQRYWCRGAGPSRWLMVVVDFGEMPPARIVTAYGNRKDPPGWKP